MPRRILQVAIFLICTAVASRAGGPAFVAGSGYNPGVEGQPLIWANGSVEYFTDQGNLSPILSGTQADAFVANAFSAWTSIPGVALTATHKGHLAEDVNGSNIETNGFGVVTAPADITPSATGTPVGIVYDYDGTVTDAILGEGAGDLADCFTNAVYGGPDNFSTAGNIVHSLVVINGVCAATSAQLPDVQYRLTRVLARTVGLGWSQANLNVITGDPPPTQADFAGFPVMHFEDPDTCVPISVCYPNAAVPKMDDIDALTRLYPSSVNPQPSGRIYGSVYFTDASGNAAQSMQGVNVVARMMVAGQPSGQYVATSVSGFLFCGNAGNIINGYVDANGLRYDRWGSDNQALEGFFDLGQLTIPTGQTTAQYQLTVEALDPSWSMGVESYAPSQVAPSGTFAPIVVTVSNGSNTEQDILMSQAEIAQPHPGGGSTYANPAALPQGGDWGSWISGYGSADFFQFTAQANRTASVAVTALDEAGQPTETKLLPVIGIWQLSDETGDPAPASTPSAFNSTTFGMTRLDVLFGVSEAFRVAVADFRGDSRPDYFYQATLLYSDTIVPALLSLAGGVTTLHGIGFSPGLQVNVRGNNGNTLSASASQIQVSLPAGSQDGTATIQVTNPVTGAFSQMIDALTYGASATDLLLLLQGAEPATPVGSQAANPIRVRAVAADGVTPVSGATIAWTATNSVQFSACNGASSCSVLSDEAGESASLVTPTVTGQSTITIALAPASYSPPQKQQATLVGTDHARRGCGRANAMDRARRDASRPSNRRSSGPGRPAAECNHQFCSHPRHSLAFRQQRNHQRRGPRHHHRKSHESKRERAGECLCRSQQFALHSALRLVRNTGFVLDVANGKRITAGHSHGAVISSSGDASNRRLECRKSGDRSERYLCHYAGKGHRRRPACPSRIVAITTGERSGRHRLHRSLGRKRRPMHHIHHGERGPIDGAVADAEPVSHRSRAAGKPSRGRCAGREPTAL
jgi:hypothetical protein